jgi:hypothetical protein
VIDAASVGARSRSIRAVSAPTLVRRALGAGFCLLAVVACVLLARRLTSTTWPLEHAHLGLAAAATGAYLASFVFRSLGWQRRFPEAARPRGTRCLAACGAGAATRESDVDLGKPAWRR